MNPAVYAGFGALCLRKADPRRVMGKRLRPFPHLTNVSKHYRKIFGLVGLNKYAEIVESEDEIEVEEMG